MKWSVVVVVAAFAVALAVVIGTRMSADAMAVLVGTVCGIGASVPTSLLLVWALIRRGQGMASGADGVGRNGTGVGYPPVVVVNPGYGTPNYGPALSMLSPPLGQSAGVSTSLPGGPRAFRVVGDEETLEDTISGALLD